MTPKNLTPLQQVHVQSPCHEDWGNMTGDDRSRFCAKCQHSVVNLSEMTEAEANEILSKSEGKLCVRYTSVNDKIVTRPNRDSWLRYLVAACLSVLGIGKAVSQTLQGSPPPSKVQVLQGDVAKPTMGLVAPPQRQIHATMGKIAMPPIRQHPKTKPTNQHSITKKGKKPHR